MYDTIIRSGSIVGADSLVKGYYPNNCILAGNVARVIRKDVAWCREDGEEDISACGDFADLTDEYDKCRNLGSDKGAEAYESE